jgi:hypothetical protein
MDSVTQVKPKRQSKDLVSQVVPACTPEVAVMEYFLSKFKDHLSKYVHSFLLVSVIIFSSTTQNYDNFYKIQFCLFISQPSH